MTPPLGLSGTGSRAALLGWTLAFQVAAVLLVTSGPLDMMGPWLRFLAYGLFGLSFAAWIGAVVRRLHDLGRSGWFAVLFPIPVIGIGMLIWAVIAAQRPVDPSRYAPAPRYVAATTILLVFALVFASRAFWVPHRVMSDHMAPTLDRGRVFLSIELGLRTIAPGQVISFALDRRTDRLQIGRVMATEGQSFALKVGVPVIDGVSANQTPCDDDRDCNVETLPGGISYEVRGKGDAAALDMVPLRVPDGAVFIMSDNRDTEILPGLASETGAKGLLPVTAIRGHVVPLPWGKME